MASSAEYTSVHQAITEVESGPHSNIVLVYGTSSDDTYKALAFQIVRSVRRIERVENTVTLADTATQSFGWVGENGFSVNTGSPGDEVFSIQDARDRTIVEYGFAVPQDGVYVAMETGDGAQVSGLRPGNLLSRQLDADTIDTRAGVLSDHTYVGTPASSNDDPIPTTALSERPQQGMVRIDSEQDGANRFYFAFNNQSGGQVDIDIIGMGAAYDVRPIQDEQTVRAMLAGNGFDRRVLQYGGFDNTNPNLPRSWYNYAVDVGPGQQVPSA